MAQRLVTDFVNTNIPGTYPKQSVKTVPVGLSTSGVIALVGEAEGGAHYSEESLSDNFYGPDAMDNVEKKYLSGNLVEAMRLLSAPSGDSRITGSANSVVHLKTNQGTKATLAVPAPSNYGAYWSQNYGPNQNKYAAELTESQSEVVPTVTGTDVPSFGAPLNGAEFIIRLQGGAETTITLSTTVGDHDNIANLVIEIAALLPSGMGVSNSGDSLIFSHDADATPWLKGYGKCFEISGQAADLTALGLTAALTVSSAELIEELNFTNSDTGLNEYFDVGGDIGLQIGHEGGTVTMTISSGVLTTTGASTNLNINLTDHTTLGDLADFISAFATEFSAQAPSGVRQLSPTILDEVATLGISSTGAGLFPGRVKVDAYSFNKKANESTGMAFVAGTAGVTGLPAPHDKVFLLNGTKGSTLAADILGAASALEGLRVNFIVPLFSRDASDDIADGLTESGSTYTIDATNAIFKTHVLEMSTAKIKRNRQFIGSYWGTFNDAKTKAGNVGHYRGALTMQKVSQVNGEGEITSFMPWASAVIAAGMQCAGFYKTIVGKLANIISFEDPTGFDSGTPSQVEQALDAGLLFMEKLTSGNSWVSDQTTYGVDTNFVFNSLQAVYAADQVALTLAESIDSRFKGESLADVDIATVLGFISKKADELKRVKLITGSSDAPLGYKNVKVSISGPVMRIKIEVKLSTGVYFIPLEIEYSEVQREGEL